MFKRIRWMSIGAFLGAGGSVYAQVKLRRRAQRYVPPEVGARVVERARMLGRDVQDALDEGRQAMRQREAELRSRLDPDAVPAPPGEIRDAASRPLALRAGAPGLTGSRADRGLEAPARRDRRPRRR